MSTLHLVGSLPRADVSPAARLSALFAYECGFRELPWMIRSFSQLLQEGFDPDLLEEIIHRTSRAPRPSWAYFSAIVGRCRFRGVFDLHGFLIMRRIQPGEMDLPM